MKLTGDPEEVMAVQEQEAVQRACLTIPASGPIVDFPFKSFGGSSRVFYCEYKRFIEGATVNKVLVALSRLSPIVDSPL
jgi:hypothetical protein